MNRGDDKKYDRDRYLRVCTTALDDIGQALYEAEQFPAGKSSIGGTGDPYELKPIEDAYARFVATDTAMPPIYFGAYKTKDLVSKICGAAGRDYGVTFVRVEPGNGFNMPVEGFVSWLIVNFSEKRLTILYSSKRIKEVGNFPFSQNKALAKVLLHECAHARLHIEELKTRLSEENEAPALEPEHERDAWLYALVVWGVLTGDHSYFSRLPRYDKPVPPDDGFLLS